MRISDWSSYVCSSDLRFNHEPRRPRKLLMREREIAKLGGAVTRQGMTLVPLSIYFNQRGRAKVELALAKGKKLHDKRESEKAKERKREQGRLMRERGWWTSGEIGRANA